MAKHKKYSEIKHADKFYEALSKYWAKVERYVWPAGIVMGVLLVVVAVWLLFGGQAGSRGDQAWARLFEIREAFRPETEESLERVSAQSIEKLASLAKEYQGRPVAAVALLYLTQGNYGMAVAKREENLKALTPEIMKFVQDRFTRSAEAAEQFVADFPKHSLVGLAQYDAGKARLELGDIERAADHFAKANESNTVAFLKVLAGWHAARCYENLGQLDKARQAYEAVRSDRMAGWCADLAEFRLARLGSSAPRGR